MNVRADRFGVDGGKSPVPRWLGMLVLSHVLIPVEEEGLPSPYGAIDERLRLSGT
jgi:hypothetical protein